MAELYFKVQADVDKIIQLRTEIENLKSSLSGMNRNIDPSGVAALESRLQSAQSQMNGMVSSAAKAGESINNNFKTKIYEASNAVTDIQSKILKQKAVIKDIEQDVRKLGDAYKTSLKSDPIGSTGRLNEFKAAKNALYEEKAALFALTQEQANARISVSKLRNEQNLLKDTNSSTSSSFKDIGAKLRNMAATVGVGFGIKELAGQIINVRGQFETMEASMKTMLGGSQEKTDALMGQIKQFAAISPLALKDVSGAAQMMLGFNIEAAKVPRFLSAIGDASMGDSVKFNSLTLAFSQMSATGKLMGQDLNQMINAGFNPLQEIARKTGKSIAELKNEMSKGAISANMVQEAFISATSEGGRFYHMSENAAKTVNGQISMLGDSVDNMFNSIGKQGEGVILDTIQDITSLVNNYEMVGKVLAGLVATYGAYRVAVVLATGATEGHTIVETLCTKAKLLGAAAMKILNATMLTNPYVLVTAAIAALVSGLIIWRSTVTDQTKAEDKLNEVKDKAAVKLEEEKQKIHQLVKAGKDENLSLKDRISACNKLNEIIPNYNARIDETTGKYIASTNALKNYLSVLKHQYEVEGAKDQLKDVGKKLAEERVLQAKLKKERERAERDRKKALSGTDIGSVIANGQTSTQIMQTSRTTKLDSLLSESKKRIAEQQAIADVIGEAYGSDIEKDALGGSSSNNTATPTTKKTGKKVKDTAAEELKKRQEAYKQLTDASLSLIKENQDAEVDLMADGTEKKLEQIRNEYKQRIVEINKQETKIKGLNKKAGVKNVGENGLTINQNKNIYEAIDLAKSKQEKAEKEVYADQIKNLYDYLKEFGTVQEQMYAIEKEYDDKIAEEKDPSKKKSLQMEKKDKLSSANAQNLAMNIDWSQSFAGIGNVLQDIAKETLDKVNEYMKTDEFKKLPADQKKSYTDLKGNLNKETGGNSTSAFNFKIWGQIADETKKYQNSVRTLQEKTKAHTDAVEKLKEAEKKLSSATDESSQKIAQAGVDAAKANVETTGNEQTAAQGQVQTAQGGLTNSTEQAKNGLDNFANAINKMSDGTLRGFADGVSNLISSLSKNGDAVGGIVGQLGSKMGGLIGAILSLLDALKDDPGKTIGGILDNIFGAIDGIISQLLSGKMETEIIGSVVKGVGNIVDSVVGALGSVLSFGALSSGGFSDWFGNSNASEVAKKTAELTSANELLTSRIEDLTEAIDDSAGESAISNYNTALQAQEEVNKNVMEVLQAQMGYHSAHHSNASYADDNTIASYNSAAQTAFKAAGVKSAQITGLDSIYGLTPEQLKALKDYVPDLWKYMTEVGKYDKSEYWDDVVEQAGKTEELTEKINKNLTQTSFDDLRSNFLSTLTDMSSDVDDFAKNIKDTMFKALVNKEILGDGFDTWLKDWQSRYAEAMKGTDTTLKESALASLRQEYTDKANELVNERNSLASATGYTGTDEQSATVGSIENITQDQAEQLIGRITATQIAAEQANVKHDLLNATASDILVLAKSQINIVDGIQTLMANSYIELRGINANTGASAAHLAKMQTDLADMYKCIKDKL